MSMNLDKPLDDIIKTNPKKRSGRGGSMRGGPGGRKVSGGGGGARAAALGKNAGGFAQAAVNMSAANRGKAPVIIPGRVPGGKNQGSKIIVGNLPLDVTEAQVKDLFASSVGPLRRVAMSYKANGQSTGQCTVEFQRAEDASRAYQTYNNRLIDGKKALRIEVVVDPARAVQAAQVQAAQAAVAAGSPAAAAGRRTGARGGRGGRGARGGGRGAAAGSAGGRTKQPKKTAEDLDAEMEDYAKATAT